MSAVIEMPRAALVESNKMSVADVLQHAKTVQEIMRTVMKPTVHFGTIPGTDKPALLKPGAELLCMMFRIADEYAIEDLSTPACIRFRVTCTGRHQTSGVVLGSGMGEASTGEEKYRWRKAVCKEEFEATPVNLRRVKYGKAKGGGFYTTEQVRTEDADLANTALKMACKRAKIAMVLNVTAASDMFDQDLEDIDEVLREHLTETDRPDTSSLRDKWVTAANEAADKDALTKVWTAGLAEIRPTKDMALYEAFKQAVGARGKQIETPAEAPAAPADDFTKAYESEEAKQ